MNRGPAVVQLSGNAHYGGSGHKAPVSDPMAAVHAKHASPLGPADGWILAAFMASVTAGIVIWAVALGYLRF
jgi:hypothetical protein